MRGRSGIYIDGGTEGWEAEDREYTGMKGKGWAQCIIGERNMKGEKEKAIYEKEKERGERE